MSGSGVYLATASTEAVRDAMRGELLGQMATPLSGNRLEPGVPWALDNGCFSRAWNETQWRRTLERHAGVPGCLFAVVPDVVAERGAGVVTGRRVIKVRGVGE